MKSIPNNAFHLRDTATGNIIDSFDSYSKAYESMLAHESDDRADGFYSPDFYEIISFGLSGQVYVLA